MSRLVRGAAGKSLALLVMVWVRVFALASDAYPRLSWSSALLTDEGFYIHNARNVALFGQLRTDDFNNALIMPLLHLVQVGVFHIFGVGAVQARLISVVCSLLTLGLFFAALRRAFGVRTAWLGLVLLGLEPAFVLYNRLALMDTPACLPLVAAFYAWVRAEEKTKRQGDRGTGRQGEEERNNHGEHGEMQTADSSQKSVGDAANSELGNSELQTFPLLLFSSSLLLPLWLRARTGVCDTRLDAPGVADSAVPAAGAQRLSGGVVNARRLAVVLAVYGVFWYGPHHAELTRVNRYYIHDQLLPHSFPQLGENVLNSLAEERGLVVFLCKHSPVITLLALIGLTPKRLLSVLLRTTAGKNEIRAELAEHDDTFVIGYMRGWLLIFIVFVSVVNYAPSRYYVLFYPALAGLAACTGDTLLTAIEQHRQQIKWQSALKGTAALLCVAWIGLNVYWYADWLRHLTYRQQEADQWLAAHLPTNSVLLGAVAPGLCLNNHFRCVSMIQNLCNDKSPVERFSPAPRYILLLDHNDLSGDGWREWWWSVHYPELITPANRLHTFPGLLRPFFTVGIYAVPLGLSRTERQK